MEQDHLEEGREQEEVWVEAVAEAEWVVIAREQAPAAIVSVLAVTQKFPTR